MTFNTTNQVRKFLNEQGLQFRGIYQTYKLADGRTVEFKDCSAKNCWHISNEKTEMVEVGE